MRPFSDIFRDHCQFVDGKHANGTDRQSNHAYGDAYASIFPDAARMEVKALLEVGCADGSGLLAFREAFPAAHCVGMDIHVADKAFGERLEFHIGNQRERNHCIDAATCRGQYPDRRFDLIVEDAWHSTENTLLTLFWLWPFVKEGGIFLVEEWHDIGSDRKRVLELFPMAEVIDTQGPFGGVEPLVVLRKKT